MIVFDKLWQIMKGKGVSTYTLREEYDFHTDTIRNLRHNQNIQTNTLSKLCKIFDCKLEDIAEYRQDEDRADQSTVHRSNTWKSCFNRATERRAAYGGDKNV